MSRSPDLRPVVNDRPLGTAVAPAFLSVVVPGLGQFLQGRRLAAAWQFGTVAFYVATSLASHNAQITWLASAWSIWSAIDAYAHEREVKGAGAD